MKKPPNPCHTITRGKSWDRTKTTRDVLGKNGLIGDYRADFFSEMLCEAFDTIRAVEVGVDHGRFLFPLAYNIGPRLDVFYGVDPYRDFRSLRAHWNSDNWNELYLKVLQTANEIPQDIIIVRATSEEAACTLPDDFNFVYIDAKHDFYGVLTDISLWEEKIVSGGILAGHDYISKKKYASVGIAVRHYAAEMGRKLYSFRGNWFWEVKKGTLDDKKDNTSADEIQLRKSMVDKHS